MSDIPFARTTCACDEDVANCKRQPGQLAPHDLGPIAARLPAGAEPGDWLCASPGAVVGDTLTGSLFRIGTITPRMKDGRCVFLTAGDRCSIHDVAPFGCAYYDVHMSHDEADRRTLWSLREITQSAEYRETRAALPHAESWRPR